jgi:hypothetical protein
VERLPTAIEAGVASSCAADLFSRGFSCAQAAGAIMARIG